MENISKEGQLVKVRAPRVCYYLGVRYIYIYTKEAPPMTSKMIVISKQKGKYVHLKEICTVTIVADVPMWTGEILQGFNPRGRSIRK